MLRFLPGIGRLPLPRLFVRQDFLHERYATNRALMNRLQEPISQNSQSPSIKFLYPQNTDLVLTINWVNHSLRSQKRKIAFRGDYQKIGDEGTKRSLKDRMQTFIFRIFKI